MKTKLLKYSLLALALTCFTPTYQLAMDAPGSSETSDQTREIKQSQNMEFAQALFQDSVINNPEFKGIYDQYQTTLAMLSGLKSSEKQSPHNQKMAKSIEKKTTALMQLQRNLKKIYADYEKQCREQSIPPYQPEEDYKFLTLSDQYFNTKLNLSVVPILHNFAPHEFALDKVFRNMEGAFLAPPLHPIEILHLNNLLVGKYFGYVQGSFKESFNIIDKNKASQFTIAPQLLGFLQENKYGLPLLADPNVMQIVLSLLVPFNVTFSSEFIYDASVIFPSNYHILLGIIGGHQKGRFVINLSEFVINMRSVPYGYPMPDMYLRGVDTVLKRINQYFSVNCKQLYDIERDTKVIDDHLTQWFNIAHRLYQAELAQWKILGPKLERLMEDYQTVMAKLELNDHRLYSGIAPTSSSIALIPTRKESKAEDRESLKKDIEEHMQTYQEEIEAYNEVKGILPTMGQAFDWLEGIRSYLIKDGQFS